MDDADYHRIFAETGTNTLEVEFGATAGGHARSQVDVVRFRRPLRGEAR